MFCTNCGNEMAPNQAVCLKCGVAKGKSQLFCGNCGAQVNPGAAICTNCGFKVKGGSDLAGQDKTVMAIVCFFLGALGIHNFMMGEVKKGIVKIVLCLLCGIGYIFALIDFVRILTDTYEVNPDKFF